MKSLAGIPQTSLHPCLTPRLGRPLGLMISSLRVQAAIIEAQAASSMICEILIPQTRFVSFEHESASR